MMIRSSGTSNGLAERETSGPDTFVLYGGPDHPTEGKFQLADGVTADWGGGNGLPGGRYGGGPAAWTPVDLTDIPVRWHVDTYNAENLNHNGSGNHAMWSGVDADDFEAAEWAHAPGYGNRWNDVLIYESAPVQDVAVGQVVLLDFYFNHDTEPGFDFFEVWFDSAGTWTTVYSVDGSNKDASNAFVPPGVQFSAVPSQSIQYTGNDYGGDSADQIRIQIRVASDEIWSDEDGFWITDGGAAQVDDISLVTGQGAFFEDYEGPGPYLFAPDKQPFAGDFADVYPRLTDIDPCRENPTPLVGFIDYNQIVRNGPGVDGSVQTGGSLDPGVTYGIPGNWVTNSYGGLSGGSVALLNEVWSPVIQWNLPGTDDDGVDVSGVKLSFSVWADLPYDGAMYYLWQIRTVSEGESWDNWRDFNSIYYHNGIPGWYNDTLDITEVVAGYEPERIQIALSVIDYSEVFGRPNRPGKPSPCFDNVTLKKYRLGGPMMTVWDPYSIQDGFPPNGSVDVSTQASRDALDIPFDMASDRNWWGSEPIMPGDSLVVRIESYVPGTWVQDARMFWALDTNPLFEDAIRAAPDRPDDENVVAGPAGTIWSGETLLEHFDPCEGFGGKRCTPSYLPWRGDLPDVDFMYPGDVLHYYIQATDTDGRTTTLPHDISGFGEFGPNSAYDRAFTVRGLPSLTDAAGSQPEILVVNESGGHGAEEEFSTSFRELGYEEGEGYDTYTIRAAGQSESNGIGSAGGHGATAAQLGGYVHIFYFTGRLRGGLLSDGSGRSPNDNSNDLGVLEQWHALAGNRNAAYFGDFIASGLTDDSSSGATYLASVMGVGLIGSDVRDAIDGQVTPLIMASDYGAAWFSTDFIANGGCPVLHEFDQIQPLPGAQAGHYFTSPGGSPITDPMVGVASVIYPTASGVDLTFPYSIMSVATVAERTVGLSARARLLAGILDLFDANPGGVPVPAPGFQRVELSVAPNPFNPVTMVRFTARPGSEGSVKVYNLRGELVRTLHAGEFQTQEFRWDGADSRGASVGSGVYLIQATDGSTTHTTKVALVK